MICRDCKFFDPEIPETPTIEPWKGICRLELPRWLLVRICKDSYSIDTPMRADDGCDLWEKS